MFVRWWKWLWWKSMVLLFTLLFCESMMNAKENPSRKKVISESASNFGNTRTLFFYYFKLAQSKLIKANPATLLKKRLWYRCFTVNFEKFLKVPFLKNTSRRLLLHLHLENSFYEKLFSLFTWSPRKTFQNIIF